jgi:hypothetical protein
VRLNRKQRAPGRSRSTKEPTLRIKWFGVFAGGKEAERPPPASKKEAAATLFQRAADPTRKRCGDSDDAVRNLQAEGGRGRGAGPSITSALFLGSKTEPWHEQTKALRSPL